MWSWYPRGISRMVVSIIFSLLRMLSSGYIPQRTLPTLWDHRNVSTRVDIATFCSITMGCGSLVVYHTSLVCDYFGMLLFYWTCSIRRPRGSNLSIHWSQESSKATLRCHLRWPQRATWTQEAFTAKSTVTVGSVFQKTSSLWAAFCKTGCGGLLDETPQRARTKIARSMGS